MSGSEPDALPLGYWAISNNILTLLTIYKQLLFKYYYLQTNHINKYPAPKAAIVRGTPIFIKSLKETSYPSFFNNPTAAILADAPIGVKLPPKVAPDNKPKYNK